MARNIQMCFLLSGALFLFGHRARTAVEQEEQTGLVSGLARFILANNPSVMDMPATTYEVTTELELFQTVKYVQDCFPTPWSTCRETEHRHKQLLQDMGETLRGKGNCLVLLNVIVSTQSRIPNSHDCLSTVGLLQTWT